MIKDPLLKRIANSKHYPWIVWGLGALFFCVEYFARLAPSVMVPNLMQAFDVDALGIGVLSGWFYVAYLGMQLPVGVLVDRFSPSKLLAFAALISGFSCFILASADHLWVASLSRFLIGFGGAFAFVGTLKLATIWFSGKKFGLLAGTTQALGMLGAAGGEGPLSILVTSIGWRDTMICIGIALVNVAFLILSLIKDKIGQSNIINPAKKMSSLKDIKEGLKEVLKNKQTWVISIIGGLLYSPTATFGELWGVTFLENVQHLSHHAAAHAVSMIFIGWAVGGPISGWFSDYIGKRKPGLFISCIGSLLTLTTVLYCPDLPVAIIFILLFLFGVMNTGVVNIYALSGEINRQSIAGTSMAFINMSSVLIGFLFQPLVGYILNKNWNGVIINNIKVYSASSYKTSMLILPICLVLAFFVSFLVKETYCKRICS